MTIHRRKKPALTVFALTAACIWLIAGAAQAETYTLRVDGLACPFCSYGIEKQLRKLSGVREVATDIARGTVTVRTDDGRKLAEADLRAAVKRAGFTLRGLN